MQADMRTDKAPKREPVSGEDRPPFRITPQIVLGLLIVLVGAALMADNLGLVRDANEILRFWPLGLVLVGAMKLFQPGDQSGRVFGGLLMFVGLAFTAEFVFRLPVNFDDWWPVVLIAFGLLILWRSRGLGSRGDAPVTQEQRVSEFATWSGKQRRVASSEFRHADLTAIMGGIELDLRGAGTATGEAVVDVFVMWGGIEIWVPPDWAVSNDVTVLMGGAEDKSTGTQEAKHRLIVRGFCVMGGLEIKT
jgi:predicted membrane protein